MRILLFWLVKRVEQSKWIDTAIWNNLSIFYSYSGYMVNVHLLNFKKNLDLTSKYALETQVFQLAVCCLQLYTEYIVCTFYLCGSKWRTRTKMIIIILLKVCFLFIFRYKFLKSRLFNLMSEVSANYSLCSRTLLQCIIVQIIVWKS